MERLETTNLVLTVLAIAAVVQTLVIVAATYGAFRAYQAIGRVLDEKLTRALVRLEGVLANLEHTSAVVRTRTDDVNRAIDSVGHTATRLGAVMWPRAAAAVTVAGGLLGVVRRWRAAKRHRPDVTIVAG